MNVYMQQEMDDWEALDISEFIPHFTSSYERKKMVEHAFIEFQELQKMKEQFRTATRIELNEPISLTIEPAQPTTTTKAKKRRNRKRKQTNQMMNSVDSIDEKYGHLEDKLIYKW